MKKLFLILFAFSAFTSYGQQETERLKITENTQDVSAIKVNVQSSTDEINWRFMSDLPISNPVRDSIVKKQNLPTGFLQGLQVSINVDNTKFNIAAGYYIITDFTNLANPYVKVITYPGATGITPAYLASANATYIALDKNQNIIQSATPFTNAQRRTLAIIGAAVHSNHVNINTVNEIKAPIVAPTNQFHDFMKAIGTLNEEGNNYSPNGANLRIDKSAGRIMGLGINANDYTNPNELTLAGQTALTFRYRLRGGTEYADTQNIDPNNYDNGGVLTAVPVGNKWTIPRINIFQSGITRIQYGQTLYNTYADALAAIDIPGAFVTEQNIADNAIFRAYLIIKQGTTDLQAAITAGTALFVPVDKFGNVIGNGAIALTYSNIIAALGFTPENVANKATDFTTVNNTLYPTVQASKTYIDSKIPTDYSKIVYVNSTDPNSATIFDLNNPPVTNDNALKNDVNNLYIGTEASTWVYNGSLYVTKAISYLTTNTPQTVSGVKTFLNSTLGFRNTADTFTSFFSNAATASRTWTLPDNSGTLALDSGLMHLSGAETFTGTKSMTIPAVSTPAIIITNPIAGGTSSGLRITNSNTGVGEYVTNTSNGVGLLIDQSSGTGSGLYVYLNNTSNTATGINFQSQGTGNSINIGQTGTGTGLNFSNTSTSKSITINNSTAASGKPFSYLKNSVEKSFLNDAGVFNAQIIRLTGYTVATLPAGAIGDTAYVTDATSPTFLATIIGGGSIKCPVFFDGTNWVAH